MRKHVFLWVLAAVTACCAPPAWAGFFDPFVHPTPPYTMDKVCDDQVGLCRNYMVYDQGAEPTERVRHNYFYDNPNEDMTRSHNRAKTYKSPRTARRH